MVTTHIETITADDGSKFSGFTALPEGGVGPGLVVIQEIFGVNDYIQDVCRRLAFQGYVAVAPDVFWRQEPDVALPNTQEAIADGIAYVMKHDGPRGIADLGAALRHVRAMDAVAGQKCGVIGFCFGGTQTFLVAKYHQPDAAVSYYGSGIANLLDGLDQLTCPILFHFGDSDPYIPTAEVETIQAATATLPNVQIHLHADGGHAFDNSFASHFFKPAQALASWGLTSAFLDRHLKT